MAKKNWTSASKVAEELGIAKMIVYKHAKYNGAPCRRDGKRVFFDIEEFKTWYEKYKATPRSLKRGDGDTVVVDLDKIPHDQNYLLWDRGKWRGWAVGHITKVDAETTRVLSSYAEHRLRFMTSALRKSIATGEVFIVDPIEVLQFLTVQLLRFGDDAPKFALTLVNQAVKELTAWKESQSEKDSAGD